MIWVALLAVGLFAASGVLILRSRHHYDRQAYWLTVIAAYPAALVPSDDLQHRVAGDNMAYHRERARALTVASYVCLALSVAGIITAFTGLIARV